MTTLASQNGKSIYITIYPGQRLVVRWLCTFFSV
jgi:hypothetical protein